MSDRTPTKAELLEVLRTSGRQALDALRAAPAEVWEQGRYENGWNAREILAHLASIEWAYPRLIDLARGQPHPPKRPTAAASDAGTEAPTGETPQIMNYNERQVAKRAGLTVEQLLAEFEHNRQATIAAVEAAEDELFGVTVTSAGGVTGPLATVMRYVAVDHVQQHVRDIIG